VKITNISAFEVIVPAHAGVINSEGLDKGSFLIYIEDVATGQKVWRGAAQGFVHDDLNEGQRQQRAADIVANVMKQFYATN